MSVHAINNFSHFFQEQLNPEQRQAVVASSGVLLVVAGAGSGKTRIITARIANLILKEGARPSSIVALTFTNKAAKEMQERVGHFLGKMTEVPFIGTFHSYCLQFLKRYNDQLTVPFFSILDEDDQHKLINGLIKRYGLNKKVTAKQLSYQISLLKNQSIDPTAALAMQYDQMLHDLYVAYEREKQESKCLDFDDLLLETVRLIKKNKEIQYELQERIAHVLVDEYQDTNTVQHELLKLITQRDTKELAITSLCVVGDEDQSIYSWRGATVANILHFQRDFPQAVTIKVEQNYRSVQPILAVANAVIVHNENRNPKQLWSDRAAINRVCQLTCVSEYQEADAVACFAKKIMALHTNQSNAVLYRAHYQSRAIEEALIKAGIPYTIIGGIQFYERKEIKDLLAYLRLIGNPFDRISFFRVVNVPNRGLGESFEELFYDRWHKEPLLTYVDIAEKLIGEGVLTAKKEVALRAFVKACGGLSPSDRPSDALERIITDTEYMTYIRENHDQQESDTKIDNIKELLYAMKHFETLGVTTIGAFLDEVALLQEKISMAKKEKNAPVVLMTLHAAKGLEFENVSIVGLNDQVLPSSRSANDPDGLEEERRLFYVGITRARERLLLSHARCRYTYGQMSECLPSQFLREIPTDLVHKHEISYASPGHLEIIIDQWLGCNRANKIDGIITFGASQHQAKKTEPEKGSSSAEMWKKHQPVEHAKFGIGTIQDVERKHDGKLYITAKFKTGSKKVEASFLKQL